MKPQPELHLAVTHTRTLCGLKCEKGIHRVRPDHLTAHIAGRPGLHICETCIYEGDELCDTP